MLSRNAVSTPFSSSPKLSRVLVEGPEGGFGSHFPVLFYEKSHSHLGFFQNSHSHFKRSI